MVDDEKKEDLDKEIKFSKTKIKENYAQVKKFFLQKNVQIILVTIILLMIIFLSTSVRLENLDLLKDQTTGEYIPLALDPFYFLRIAETMVSEGGLPEVDAMRYPSLNLGFSNEMTPKAVVFLWNIGKILNSEISIRYINVLSPVIFFALGILIFFFLCYVLTNSKKISLLSTAFLAFIPAYLYRTTAGFSDHESIGMFAFFIALLIYVISMKDLEKEKTDFKKIILFSVLTGILTAFTLVSWGGVAQLLFLLIPASFLVIWLLKFKENKKHMKDYLLFYLVWVVSTIISGIILFGLSFGRILGNFTNSTGILGGFCVLFFIIDYFIIQNKAKLKIKEKYRWIYSIIASILVGIIALFLMGGNFFNTILYLIEKILTPFGTDRVSLTVAENAQPYLTSWISQIGKTFFWIFFVGVLAIGVEIGNNFSKKKDKISFFIGWAILVSGILFSRISSSSVFNGENFISKLFYFGSLIIFLIISIKIYKREEMKLDSSKIILGILILLSLISVRSASRVFFLIAPFACLPAAFLVFKTFEYFKKSKDELLKIILAIVIILLLILSIYNLVGFYQNSKAQVNSTGPSATSQWQKAMAWIRENTEENSIFIHWWDYGYWVQYLGERPTVTDGGHGNSYWDHLIGRYVLTTTNPATALDFMKSHDVSYLLIDQTDLGKYSAYSKIGGDENFDSFSVIPTGIADPQYITETANSTKRAYQLGGIVDEDIYYQENGVFLPGPTYDEIGNPTFNSYIAGVIVENSEKDGIVSFYQPNAVYVYNSNQIALPIRYIYYDGQLIDFGSGIESVIRITPRVYQDSSGNGNVDPLGAIIYLSPKVSQSLFAQLYLLDDVFNNYPTIKLVHSEEDSTVNSLKAFGINYGSIIYYGGVIGPIKIFEVSYTEDTKERDEFRATEGEYAGLDYLFE